MPTKQSGGIRLAGIALLALGCGGAVAAAPVTLPAVPRNALRAPRDFAAIPDRDDRARAIFVEASRVMLHARCTNCHPAGDSPTQGEDGRMHDPPVARGPSDTGVPALECASCHQDRNLELARVPGAPKWHLAPIEMAWVGKTPGALCEQLKDRKRNGDKSLAEIAEHTAHDELVAWGWAPGHGREPAPGTQAEFAALVGAWVKEGAACPRDEVKR
ncbi:MAG: Isoquinoline 1-oxidoreductase subunit [Labilithrix sp.]|nr:Isoquinoline 1-oxidoreductase subunit [Labilithrix sp.]